MAEEPDMFDLWLGKEATFATAVGQFAMRFAVFEHSINEAIREMLALEEAPGGILTSAIQSFSLRLDILEALLDGLPLDAKCEKELRHAVKQARELNGVRNSLLHDRWTSIFMVGGLPTTFKKKRFVKEGSKGRKRGLPPFKSQNLEFSEAEVLELGRRCFLEARKLVAALNILNAKRVDGQESRDYVFESEDGPISVSVIPIEDAESIGKALRG